MLESLHIEKSALNSCGYFINGGGLEEILLSCGLSIVGRESLTTVNHIKKARYCLQVAACVIYSLLISAQQESKANDSVFD